MTIAIPEESSQVVKETLQREIYRLKEKLDSFIKQLKNYEQQHQFSSEKFLMKFNSGGLGDEQVLFEWYADLQTFNKIKSLLILLEKIKLD